MPSPSVKTIKDLIFYQYAKIIAESVGLSKSNGDKQAYYGFVMDRVKRLRNGEINMSTVMRELKMQMSSTDKRCEYCEKTEDLSWDHLIPLSKGGLDSAENLVLCCRSCNSSKGSKGLYAWIGMKNKDSLPRLIAGKYLKLLFDLHDKRGTLHSSDLNGDGKLDVFDLEIY